MLSVCDLWSSAHVPCRGAEGWRLPASQCLRLVCLFSLPLCCLGFFLVHQVVLLLLLLLELFSFHFCVTVSAVALVSRADAAWPQLSCPGCCLHLSRGPGTGRPLPQLQPPRVASSVCPVHAQGDECFQLLSALKVSTLLQF